MDICNLLKTNGKVYLTPDRHTVAGREYCLDESLRTVLLPGVAKVKYIRHLEYCDDSYASYVHLFELYDSWLAITVSRETLNVTAVYIVRGTTVPDPGLILEPDECLRRFQVLGVNGYTVYNAWLLGAENAEQTAQIR